MLATSTTPLPLTIPLPESLLSQRPAFDVPVVLINPVLQFNSIYESNKGLHGSVGLGAYRQEG